MLHQQSIPRDTDFVEPQVAVIVCIQTKFWPDFANDDTYKEERVPRIASSFEGNTEIYLVGVREYLHLAIAPRMGGGPRISRSCRVAPLQRRSWQFSPLRSSLECRVILARKIRE